MMEFHRPNDEMLNKIKESVNFLGIEISDVSMFFGLDPALNNDMALSVSVTIFKKHIVTRIFPEALLMEDNFEEIFINSLSREIQILFYDEGPDDEGELHQSWLAYENKLFWDFIDKAPQNSTFNK